MQQRISQWTTAGALALASALSLASAAHAADTFPAHPLRLIVPFAAGSGPDVNARLMAHGLETRIGQAVTVENHAGANSLVGCNMVAKSAPDGYTLLYATNSGTSAARALFKEIPYDPTGDFAGVAMSHQSALVLIVAPEHRGETLAQFVEKMRADPARYAIGGSSTTGEILSALLKSAGKTEHTYVRYANSANELNDVMGGRIGGSMSAIPGLAPLVAAGKIYPLAVTSAERVAAFPNTPTMADTYPGLVLTSWSGYFVPAKSPRPAIAYLYQKMTEVFKDPAVDKSIQDAGSPYRMTPEEMDTFLKKDEQHWLQVVHMAGMSPQ